MKFAVLARDRQPVSRRRSLPGRRRRRVPSRSPGCPRRTSSPDRGRTVEQDVGHPGEAATVDGDHRAGDTARRGERRDRGRGRGSAVTSTAATPSPRASAVARADTFIFWNLKSGSPLLASGSGSMGATNPSPDGRSLVSFRGEPYHPTRDGSDRALGVREPSRRPRRAARSPSILAARCRRYLRGSGPCDGP